MAFIKALSKGLLTAMALVAISVTAQVSFVEGIEPLEGVVIPKIKIEDASQFKVDEKTIRSVAKNNISIAISIFRGQQGSPQDISSIISADLERSGQFKSSPTGVLLDENSHPDFNTIKQNNIDAVLTGSITKRADDSFDVRYRLWDAVKTQDLGGQSFIAMPGDLRLASHKIADQIYEKLTGDKGIFITRITFVTKQNNRYMLWVADADGKNAQAALTSPEPIISPCWAPNGKELAYVSFESRKPVVYVHDVGTGKRRVLANFRGSNSAPAWSPDGQTFAVTLTKEDGGSQIFVMDAKGGEPRRITQSNGNDTEPVFSPDGSTIYFVSDLSGSPQIYRISVNGGPVQRITFNSNFNASPAVSPDGKWLAYISLNGNSYQLTLMDLFADKVKTITDSSFDSKPSFAPNSKLILYATEELDKQILMTITLDGMTKIKISNQMLIREPNWAPFLKP